MAKILVVDDAEFVRVRLREMLTEMGFEVCEANNGLLALDLCITEMPDLIICDINMPHMDGLEFLKTLMERDPEALVVMLSSNKDDAVLSQCFLSGAQAYLLKPFNPEETYNTIAELLGIEQ